MKLNIIKQRNLWWTISALCILAGLVAMAISYTTIKTPLLPSLDFVGGTRIQLELSCVKEKNCQVPVDTGKVQELLTEQGLSNSSVQVIDNYGLSIRTEALNVEQRTNLQTALNEKVGKFDPETIQIDTVGPAVGKELFEAGFKALILSFFGILVYLSLRFQFDYAFFAFIALFHDVLITVGFFAILGLVAKVEVDSLFLVALLTIVGFSVNDTVVIYDRVRENLVKFPDKSISEIVDDSVNQTLSRSINTVLSTLFPLVAIFLFGGATLKYFSLALIFGFVMGSYSSIFIASTLLAWWRERQDKSVGIKSVSS